MQDRSYRPDIDGLRAVAVLAVVIFHAFPASISGGFVGVDIFFVISGFLITSILLKETSAHQFSIVKFYVRRIRRIFPALLLVLFFTFFVAWLLFLPSDFFRVSKNTVASALFGSNLLLAKGKGYFDTSETLNPLLHLWSLGVEEQFYIFWPVILFVVAKMRFRVMPVLAVLAIGSFAFNIWGAHAFAGPNFYNPVSRFWELLAGAFLAQLQMQGYRPSARVSQVSSVAGGALLALSFFWIDDGAMFPGWWAVLPVAGATLIILAGENGIVNAALLSRRPMVFVGLISYPLYLWHWPLLAIARVVSPTEPSALTNGVLVLAAVALSCLTYFYVERPIREKSWNRLVVPKLVAGNALAIAFGFAAYTSVLPSHAAMFYGPLVNPVSAADRDWVTVWGDGFDVIRADQKATLFIGDSFMEQYYPRIAYLARTSPRSLMIRISPACAPVLGVDRLHNPCLPNIEKAFARASKPDVDRVVLAGFWSSIPDRGDYYDARDPAKTPVDMLKDNRAYDALAKQLRALTKAGKKVTIILDHPKDMQSEPEARIERVGFGWRPTPHHDIDLATFRERTAAINAKLRSVALTAGATIIDPTDYLCVAEKCPTIDAAGAPIYKDRTHLRAQFTRQHATFLDDLAR